MAPLENELMQLVTQFFKEEDNQSLAHRIEEDMLMLFDIEYFKNQVAEGEWNSAEKYLSKFTKPEDNEDSCQIFFELRQQKFMEALDKGDGQEALDILKNELQVFKASHKKSLAELTRMSKKTNFRNQKIVSGARNTKATRTKLLKELVKLLTANPKFDGKLEPLSVEKSRLCKVVKQALEWQHKQCKNPRSDPIFTSLYKDHSCDQQDEAPAPSPGPSHSMRNNPNADESQPIGDITVPLQPTQASLPSPVASETPARRPTAPSGSSSKRRPVAAESAKSKKKPAPPTFKNPSTSKRNANTRCALKRQMEEEVDNIEQDQDPRQNDVSINDLPLTVVASLGPESYITSMDFHPVHQELLLAGTTAGIVYIWDLSSEKVLKQTRFNLWDFETCSPFVQASLGSNPSQEVTRVKWSPDGEFFGVSHAKYIVHVYSFRDRNFSNYLQLEADRGAVYDVAFTRLKLTAHNNELLVITAGQERTVKVWDSFSGALMFQFDGHDDVVVSVSPQIFAGRPAIFAADLSGSLKIWPYEHTNHCLLNISIPHHVNPHIAFSGNGSRMFLGGTSKPGHSSLVELSVNDGSIKLAYDGLLKPAGGFLRYDVVKGKYLAANDASMLKFWKMDSKSIFKMTDAGGGLHPSGPIKVNKEGTFLAVATSDLYIKILANADGQKLLRIKGKSVFDAPRPKSAVPVQNASVSNTFLEASVPGRSAFLPPDIMDNYRRFTMFDRNFGMIEEQMNLATNWSLKEIYDVAEIHCTRILNKFSRKPVSWLAYAKSGRAILAQGANGEHKLWQWKKTAKNPDGKPTGQSGPYEWQPPDELKMVNDVGYTNPDGHVSCFALPKNRHYVLSASGGIASVYDIKTFKTLAKIMPPPPAATSMAIHPNDSNILVFGMEDSSVHIYHFRQKEVVSKLTGHGKRVTGLAFSEVLNVLVSSGADSKICVWSIDEWKHVGSTLLQVSRGLPSDTRLEFHKDQKSLMAIHKTQLAIFEAPKLIPLNSWAPQDVTSLIKHAAYSCDGESIFVALGNGCVEVLTGSSLELKCKIHPTAFIPPNVRSEPLPTMIVANPSEPNQFALGLTDGAVAVMEPLEKEGTWGTPPVHNKSGPNEPPGDIDLDQLVWEDEEDDI